MDPPIWWDKLDWYKNSANAKIFATELKRVYYVFDSSLVSSIKMHTALKSHKKLQIVDFFFKIKALYDSQWAKKGKK